MAFDCIMVLNFLNKLYIWMRVFFVRIPKEIKYKLQEMYDMESFR